MTRVNGVCDMRHNGAVTQDELREAMHAHPELARALGITLNHDIQASEETEEQYDESINGKHVPKTTSSSMVGASAPTQL